MHDLNALKICDHPERSSSRRSGAPVRIVVVLATFQEVLVSVVVGLFIEYPRTVHHHAGVELTQLEGLVNWWAVYDTLCSLASKILFIIKSDLPGLPIHLEQIFKKEVWIHLCAANLQTNFHPLESSIRNVVCRLSYDWCVTCCPTGEPVFSLLGFVRLINTWLVPLWGIFQMLVRSAQIKCNMVRFSKLSQRENNSCLRGFFFFVLFRKWKAVWIQTPVQTGELTFLIARHDLMLSLKPIHCWWSG